MNICIVTPYSPFHSKRLVSGIGSFIRNLSLYLNKRDNMVYVITNSMGNEIKDNILSDSGVNVTKINTTNIYRLKDLYLALISFINILEIRKQIDLIYLITPREVTALSAIVGKIINKPVLLGIHGHQPLPKSIIRIFYYKVIWKITTLLSREIIFISKDVKFHFKRDPRIRPLGVGGIVIPDCIDEEMFSYNEVARKQIRAHLSLNNDFTLLFVGRITYNKGIHELIDVCSKLVEEREKIRLLMIGSIPNDERRTIQQKIKRNALADHVTILSSRPNIRYYLSSADLFVLPSWHEGLGTSMLEAMATGLPVIGSNVGGIKEVIENNDNGLLFEAKNTKDLHSKIKWCISNKAQCRAMAINAKEKIQSNYSLDKVESERLRVLESLIQ